MSTAVSPNLNHIQALSHEFAIRELFRRQEATSNDLNSEFDRPSLRLMQLFCPNFSYLKKNLQTDLDVFFSANFGDLQKDKKGLQLDLDRFLSKYR